MKLLFLTRVHPPVLGGLENQSAELVRNVRALNPATFVVANTRGKRFLPLFLPWSFLQSLFLIVRHGLTHLHVSDAVLAGEACLLKWLTGVKTIATVHGLDITWKPRFYQAVTPRLLGCLDRVICVSSHTRHECIKRGVPAERCVVVPNGVDVNRFPLDGDRDEIRRRLCDELKIDLCGRKLLLTVGRLVRRKGVDWFVSNVLPRLDDCCYLIIGDGPDRGAIQQSIDRLQLAQQAFLAGKLAEETVRLAYNAADYFIMPNIHVPGDMEGFGIVAIEAGSCGLPVIAAGVEGIRDAVIDGTTGWLVQSGDPEAFVRKIRSGPLDRHAVAQAVRDLFDWEQIARRYLVEMR